VTAANTLGEYLRARRELVDPKEVGLRVAGVRRTPGLRREEVATLAGISADYYLRLEQGRDRHPSGQVLEALAHAGAIIPVTVDGLPERAYLGVERLDDLEHIRSGAAHERTTLLSPFDSLIWDRLRARQLFGHEVVFEAYVVPEKRRYGYYSLAILHRGQIVGRLDPKMDRATQQLLIRGVYLEPDVAVETALLDGLSETLRDLARFLGATSVTVERSEPAPLATKIRPLLKASSAKSSRKRARVSATMTSGA